MNSVLQCLLHTPPLAELLLSGRSLAHGGGGTNGFDPIAITRQLLQESLTSRREYVSPQLHARTLKRVSKRCAVCPLLSLLGRGPGFPLFLFSSFCAAWVDDDTEYDRAAHAFSLWRLRQMTIFMS